ncbi:putative Ubiquitin protein [Spironucleus salmonicida]|uniref:Ubiquitin protein n=1 Tax=Spironucleus salmonicida TaxID=348837 RepID=V6LWB5_9EUKA|nr:putative Ubiquitin protein [Spironucleus salmonicida]|eukprot:EST48860.1 hypothetical protein SS50377_10959 [Spironucleus salmonicida]
MKIIVKILKTKETLSVEVPQEANIQEIISQLNSVHNINGEIRLVHNAKMLKPDQSIASAQLIDDVVLYATIKEVKKVVIEETNMPELQVQQTQSQPQQPQQQVQGKIPFQMPHLNQDPKEMMQNPFVQQMMQAPGFMESMMNNPMMQQLKEKNPQIAELLEDPELQKQMADTMSDPVKLDEMLRQQDAMMNTVQNTPGAMQMYQKLQYDMEEIQNDFMQKQGSTAGNGFLPDDDNKNQQAGTGAYHTKNIKVDEFSLNLPRSYTDTLQGFYGDQAGTKPQNQQNQQYQAPQNNMFGGIPDFANMPNMPNKQQMDTLMNDPQMQQMIDGMIDNPEMFNMYMQNPMIRQQLEQSNPMMAQMLDNPEQMRNMMIQARNMMRNGDMQQAPQIPKNNGFAPRAAVAQSQEEKLQDLKQRFGAQCTMIKDMGLDFQENEILLALDFCNGNVETAINYLLDNQ